MAAGSIGYGPLVDAVGFDLMPRPVIDALSGLLIGPPVAADAKPLVAKRQSDGTHYQQAVGWWAGADRYLTIDARRLLAPVEGQRLKPVSGWKIDGTVSYFRSGVMPTHSEWRFDPGTDSGAKKKSRERVSDPLDALPEELVRPVRDADANAWRRYRQGWAEETIVAALAGPDRIKVLKAQRTATSRRALDSANWHVETLDAPIASVQALTTDGYGRVLLGPPAQVAAIPPGPAPGRPIGPPA
jgi:hypothetical protein